MRSPLAGALRAGIAIVTKARCAHDALAARAWPRARVPARRSASSMRSAIARAAAIATPPVISRLVTAAQARSIGAPTWARLRRAARTTQELLDLRSIVPVPPRSIGDVPPAGLTKPVRRDGPAEPGHSPHRASRRAIKLDWLPVNATLVSYRHEPQCHSVRHRAYFALARVKSALLRPGPNQQCDHEHDHARPHRDSALADAPARRCSSSPAGGSADRVTSPWLLWTAAPDRPGARGARLPHRTHRADA